MGICCCIHDDAVYKPAKSPIEIEEIKIDYIPTYPSDSFVCTICLDEEDKSEVECSPCGHMFHKQCLRSWWKYSYTCPYCNVNIKNLVKQIDNLS